MALRRMLVKMLDPESAADDSVAKVSGGKFIVGPVPLDLEALQDAVAAMLVAGTNISLSYDDVAGTLTITGAGGGGGGGVGNDRRWNVGSGETTVDEFNDNSLDPAWGRVDNANSGFVSWSEGADTLIATHTTGTDSTNQVHALLRPLSSIGGSLAVGDGVVTCLQLSMAQPGLQYAMSGLILSTTATASSGNQLHTLNFTTSGALSQTNDLRAMSTFSAAVGAPVGSLTTPIGAPLYVRLSLIAANTWRQDLSANGVSWQPGAATLTWANTPTHVGFLSSNWGVSRSSQVSYEFLRRVSGVT